MELPSIPVPLNGFVPYLNEHSRDEVLTGKAMEPFKAYEYKLREIFAQEPNNKAIENPHVNVVPLYLQPDVDVKVKARDLVKESPADAEKYILPLAAEARKNDSTAAVVPTFNQFLENFRIFSESSLVDMDWSNVVVAGSAVTTCLLPVPDKFGSSRKAQREYYHEKIAPSSDVDLFLYGLDEEQAIEKIKQIEKCIRDSILEEVSVIRTKNALTIVSKYPTRHVQIVLRLYKSVSEVLTGFDVDCSCTAFDGRQVWASPRAVAAFATQTNSIDLTRRSPSYENRLAKYAHRGFEVYWPALDRSRLDPTIFERSFNHVVGLARLLVMEKLPTQLNRENYLNQRREERGRATPSRTRAYYVNRENLKEVQPEDVAEWVEEEDVSRYHTFTIPYGPKYTAKKIEKMVYKNDLLLNAEWNRPKDRKVNLHRHPAFFGSVKHVIEDCCGYCPAPSTEEEKSIAADEGKKYLSGKIQFMKHDPGRQTIGSFNPITDSDWTEFAYTGGTESLCQAIVAGDLTHVKKCCAQEDFNIDQRDHTGRMPLHLAINCGTPEIVRCLVHHGARLVSRVAGGFTALHLAAARGDVEILRAILRKSEANQVEYLENSGTKQRNASPSIASNEDGDEEAEEDDISVIESGAKSPYAVSQGSMIVVTDPSKTPQEEQDEDENEPNFYDDIGVLSWDHPISPLHVAILYGHTDIITTLTTEFGADASQPFVQKEYNNYYVIFSMILAMHLPFEQSTDMLRTLLELGASSTQANKDHITAFHSLVIAGEPRHIDLIFDIDAAAAQLAINHPFISTSWRPQSALPLNSAISYKGTGMVEKLLEKGAIVSGFFERLRRIWARRNNQGNKIEHILRQPIIQAAEFSTPAVVKTLLDAGAEVNAITTGSHRLIDKQAYYSSGQTVLDLITARLDFLKSLDKPQQAPISIVELKPDVVYLKDLAEGTFEHSFVQNELAIAKLASEVIQDKLNSEECTKFKQQQRLRADWIEREIKELEALEQTLKAKGGKPFAELYPEHARAADKTQKSSSTAEASKEFEVACTFTDQDVGDVDTKEYIPLFQAAWDGNIGKVKQLTTEPATVKKPRSSLQLTARLREREVDIFTIAVVRGHFELARGILQDVDAQQWKRDTKKSTRKVYEVVVDNDNDYNSYDSDSEPDAPDSEGVNVRFDIVDDEQTIDDVRELEAVSVGKYTTSVSHLLNRERDMSMFLGDENKDTVKADHATLADTHLLNWYRDPITQTVDMNAFKAKRRMDLMSLAVQRNDFAAVKFLVEQKTHYLRHSKEEDNNKSSDEDRHKFITIGSDILNMCLRDGCTQILGYLMSTTGLGFPFEALMKEAGVKPETEPKFYRGLSVYGKKRANWAAENSYRYFRPIFGSHSLLLLAISEGNIDAVKWFLTDAPEQKYKEFLHTHRDDARLAPLFKMEGGIDDMLASWLGARRNLALHCAILASPSEKSSASLVQFILESFPDSLHTKNIEGFTPLHLAFSGRRITAAKMLVEAGADQAARDNDGRNMLHHIFASHRSTVESSPKLLRTLCDILDPEIVPILAQQRSRLEIDISGRIGFGRQIPLSQWLSHGPETETATLEAILDITGGKELYILNEQGNYPIHEVIKDQKIDFARVMLERDPRLAVLENATGTTPLEVAENRLISYLVNQYRMVEENIGESGNSRHSYSSSAPVPYRYFLNRWRREPEKFDPSQIYNLKGDGPFISWDDCKEGKILQLLRSAAAKSDKKRILISLQDSNELVRRLSAIKPNTGDAGRRANRSGYYNESDEEERAKNDAKEQDEVKKWMGYLSRKNFEVERLLEEEKNAVSK
ncbi:ankyrin repeat protein [Histoplasma capsulatum G186AR]|uniref:Ankyrin repeat protein n=2 Tax=Ajellomyces capsulatus TaxID=5037 RepID=C0NF07_AJECG|nr:ankyrin repeat protein [Histoplasma capsulatum G186AR]EEH09828.1 ankyrin repeat protein [Histoplasma capsulatum G186AR]KAG5298850.1 ankyrin repeat protein [Histoplasma capsulatum]QSS73157.1 ankyrin repeat protein [Histoplasma capsulatum G186AR]